MSVSEQNGIMYAYLSTFSIVKSLAVVLVQIKTAELVYQALVSIRGNLNDIQMFHTDRGKEFDNKLISKALETFGIQRSLSMKGCPYDNAVAEAMFKVFKTEFANGAHFSTLEQLALELDDYVHWFNNIRIHGTLGYLTPVEFKQQTL